MIWNSQRYETRKHLSQIRAQAIGNGAGAQTQAGSQAISGAIIQTLIPIATGPSWTRIFAPLVKILRTMGYQTIEKPWQYCRIGLDDGKQKKKTEGANT
jgi:hypothetical protein